MKKIVVTGALGFIGFHLCKKLIESGYEVVAIDEMVKERQNELEEMRMRLGRNALFHLIEKKVEELDLESELKDIDAIYHLAALTKYDSKWPRLQEVIAHNVALTKKILLNAPPQSRFIFPSTVQVYGERPGLITEKTPTNPTSAYGITKLASETLIRKLAPEQKVEYVIFRLPSVYGPFQRSDMTYQQILEGVDYPKMDRSQIDILYIDDVIEAFMLALDTEHVNEVYQLATGKLEEWFEGIKVLKMDEERINKSKIKTTLSTEKSKQLLGFEAKTPVSKGLKQQKEHYEMLKNQTEVSGENE
ncbi:NAD-dependent epimerase/dehydratase family protein [Alkalihalobacillus sp. 1P02AB]|uniref:NAD-dependent epimerase/dehydratase family protein n=1 Tax=Alkalihalobacillus sp. 1P02AB TaxID=3132260 RepID=UPI0039A6D3BF